MTNNIHVFFFFAIMWWLRWTKSSTLMPGKAKRARNRLSDSDDKKTQQPTTVTRTDVWKVVGWNLISIIFPRSPKEAREPPPAPPLFSLNSLRPLRNKRELFRRPGVAWRSLCLRYLQVDRGTQRKRCRRLHTPPPLQPPPPPATFPPLFQWKAVLSAAGHPRVPPLEGASPSLLPSLPPSESAHSVLSCGPSTSLPSAWWFVASGVDGLLDDNRDECCDLSTLVTRSLWRAVWRSSSRSSRSRSSQPLARSRFYAYPVPGQDAVSDGAGRQSRGRGKKAQPVQALREFPGLSVCLSACMPTTPGGPIILRVTFLSHLVPAVCLSGLFTPSQCDT